MKDELGIRRTERGRDSSSLCNASEEKEHFTLDQFKVKNRDARKRVSFVKSHQVHLSLLRTLHSKHCWKTSGPTCSTVGWPGKWHDLLFRLISNEVVQPALHNSVQPSATALPRRLVPTENPLKFTLWIKAFCQLFSACAVCIRRRGKWKWDSVCKPLSCLYQDKRT